MSRFDQGAAGPSQRQLRVGELIRHELSGLLSRGEVNDPELAGVIISVGEVRVSPDLKVATALVMPLGGKDKDKIIVALTRSSKWLRGQVARRITLKFAPEIRFRLDTRYEDDDRINAMLRTPDVKRDIEGEDGE
jgi:ribosome-binding factor A